MTPKWGFSGHHFLLHGSKHSHLVQREDAPDSLVASASVKALSRCWVTMKFGYPYHPSCRDQSAVLSRTAATFAVFT